MMDETKLAGCKRTLIQAAKQMAEEYSDAMNYADFAVEYKSVCPSAASECTSFPATKSSTPKSTPASDRRCFPWSKQKMLQQRQTFAACGQWRKNWFLVFTKPSQSSGRRM